MIKKILLTVILVVFLGMVYSYGNAKDVPLSEIDQAFSKAQVLSSMEKASPRQVSQFFKIESSQYEDCLYYRNTEALSVEEVLIIKVKTKNDISPIKDALENRISSQIKAFDGYGPKQVALVKNHKLFVKGNYIFFCVGKKPDKIAEVFKDAI